MHVVRIPQPSVVVLIGAAGAGKSTLARRLFKPAEILSSDALRAAITGDERDQRANGAVFRAIARDLERHLGAGTGAVIDATNLAARDRRPWLLAAERHGVPAVALVLDLPAAVVHEQDRGRARVVGPEVVDRHLAGVRRTVDAGDLRGEGFALVVIVRSVAERDGLTLVRDRA